MVAVEFVRVLGSPIKHIACSNGTLCGIEPDKPFPVIESTSIDLPICFKCIDLAQSAVQQIKEKDPG